jgi:hypothetical protein
MILCGNILHPQQMEFVPNGLVPFGLSAVTSDEFKDMVL